VEFVGNDNLIIIDVNLLIGCRIQIAQVFVLRDFLLVVDALASASIQRLLTTIQISDTGLVPGSGVGNARAGLTREKLGLPVIAIGVPTVIHVDTLVKELSGSEPGSSYGDLVVTPKEIDDRLEAMAKFIGYGINLALHPALSFTDIAQFLS